MFGVGKKKAVITVGDDDLDEAPSARPTKRAAQPAKEARSRQDAPTAEKEPDAAARVLMEIGFRNDYYRDSFRRAWTVVYILGGALILSAVMNIIQYKREHFPLPIAVTPDGRVFEVTPLTDPVMNPDGVRQWAGRTIPAMYGLNFRDYREQMAALEPFFTPEGYKGYLAAIQRFRMIDQIIANNYIASAAPSAAPQVIQERVLNGVRQWVVRAPIVVTYDNGLSPVNQTLTVTAIIVRVPETQNPFGLSIHSFAAAR